MTYTETIDYLYASAPMFHKQGSAAYKEGLENTLALDKYFEHPTRSYLTIHVAGTNGKGSCSAMLASYLQTLGYKVGLYTSPHLYSFRERIRVGGEMIPEREIVDFVECHRHFFEPLRPSFFELTTALAFKYFEKIGVDIAVVEVGLGGRLDCTNIIRPVLSIITNISLDHTELLGSTLQEIALQKAGIIKRGVPVVIGETLPETQPVFAMEASRQETDIYYASQMSTPQEVSKYAAYCSLSGNYQQMNVRTVLAAVKLFDEIGLRADPELFIKSLRNIERNTGIMGRWQTVSERPRVILDTAHNVAGWQFVSKMLAAVQGTGTCPGRAGTSSQSPVPSRLHIVFGMVDDKDIEAVMDLLPRDAVYYFTQADSHRAIPAEKVRRMAERHSLRGEAFPKAQDAFNAAKKNASDEDVIFIGGSNYVIGEIVID